MGRRSSPRGGDDSRGQSASRRSSGEQGGKKEQSSISLLVRNIPHDCSSDLLAAFQKFGRIQDFYIPKDYHSGEPRGFAFVEFWDSRDASEARRHMNNKMLCGREIKVVTAVGKRKRPDGGVRGHSDYKGRHLSRHGRPRSRSHSRSPRRGGRNRSRSHSPAPRRRGDYSASPKRKEEYQTKSSGQTKAHDKGKKQEPCTPRDRSDRHDADNGSNRRRATPDYSAAPKRTEEYQTKSPRQAKTNDEDKRQRSYAPSDRNDCQEARNGHNERRATTDGKGSCLRQRSPRPSSGSHSRRRDDYSASPKGKEEHQEQSPRHSKEYGKCKKQRSNTPDNRNDRHDADHSHNEIQDDHPTSPKIKEECHAKSSGESKEYDKDRKQISYSPHDRNDRHDADNGSKDNVHVDRKPVTPDGEGSHAGRRSPGPSTRSSSRRQDDYSCVKRKEVVRAKSPKQSNEHEYKKRRSYTPDDRNDRCDADNYNKKKQDDYSASRKRKEECRAKSPCQTKEREVKRRSYAPDDRIVGHEAVNGYNERRASPDNGSLKRTEEPRQAKSQSQSNEHDNDKNQRSYTRDERKDRCNADNASKERRNDYSASGNKKEEERGENFPRQSKEHDENKKRGSLTLDDRNDHHDTDNGSKEWRDGNSAPQKRMDDHHAKSPRQSKEHENDKKRGSYVHDDRKDHCDADNGSRERRDDYSASRNRKEERRAKSPRQSKEHDDKKRGSFTPDDRNDHHDTDNGSKKRDDNSAARNRMEDHRAKSPRQSKEHENDKKRGSYTRDDRKDRCDEDNGSRDVPRRRDDYTASEKRMENHRAKSPRQSKEHENDKKRGSYTHDDRKDRCDADNGSRERDDYVASRKRKEECRGKSPRQSNEHDENKKRGSCAPDDRNDPRDADNGCNEKLATPDGEGSHGRSARPSSEPRSGSGDKSRGRRS